MPNDEITEVVQLRRRPRAQVKRIMEERASTLEYCAKELELMVTTPGPAPIESMSTAGLLLAMAQRFRDLAELTRSLAGVTSC